MVDFSPRPTRLKDVAERAGVSTATVSRVLNGLGPTSEAVRTQSIPAINKIRVALIGANGMGFNNLVSFLKNPEIECIALCDVDKNVLDKRMANLADSQVPAPKLYADYRKMLENKDIDVVIIGTPDHWHCLPLVDALSAGKSMYVEKPLGNSIAEILIMQKAARNSGKMVQVEQWQRSQPHFVDAINFLKTGALGRIRTCKAWSYVDWKGGKAAQLAFGIDAALGARVPCRRRAVLEDPFAIAVSVHAAGADVDQPPW